MPRAAAESRLRRFMMQAIMWIVLAGTVGLAAIVNHARRQDLNPSLGQPRTFGQVTLRLPDDWQISDSSEDPRVMLVAWDRVFERQLIVSEHAIGLLDLLGLSTEPRSAAGRRTEPIQVGDDQGVLSIHHEVDDQQDYYRLSVSRGLPGGRVLLLTLIVPGQMQSRGVESGRELLKRIAASVQIDTR
ncbi:hypothetical protein [Fontivita pretiosa]|uniref:hypothetical protein n=1 Tax=Fontivita pretiosa TaxID=2989684 RepID=UPI003D186AB2